MGAINGNAKTNEAEITTAQHSMLFDTIIHRPTSQTLLLRKVILGEVMHESEHGEDCRRLR